MLRVQAGWYRDVFCRVGYDVYRVKPGVWSFRATGQNAIGLNLGRDCDRQCETKEGAARMARVSISIALDPQKK